MSPVLGCDLVQKGLVPALSSPGCFICYIKGPNSYLSRGSPNLLSESVSKHLYPHLHPSTSYISLLSQLSHTCSVLTEPILDLGLLRTNICW